MIAVYCSLFTLHSLLFTVHCLLFTVYSSLFAIPGFAIRELKVIERILLHFDAIARSQRRHVTVALHQHGVDEVVVQMIYIFQHPILQRAADSYVVEDGKVLDILAQAHSTCMRTNRNAKLRRHQQYGKHFINSSKATAVYLAEVDRASLQ